MRMMRFALPLMAAIGLSGCAGMSQTQQTTATGALIGAAGGGVLGSFSGDTALGALLGAGVGAAGGYLYDQSQQSRARNAQYDRRAYNQSRNRGRRY